MVARTHCNDTLYAHCLSCSYLLTFTILYELIAIIIASLIPNMFHFKRNEAFKRSVSAVVGLNK